MAIGSKPQRFVIPGLFHQLFHTGAQVGSVYPTATSCFFAFSVDPFLSHGPFSLYAAISFSYLEGVARGRIMIENDKPIFGAYYLIHFVLLRQLESCSYQYVVCLGLYPLARYVSGVSTHLVGIMEKRSTAKLNYQYLDS